MFYIDVDEVGAYFKSLSLNEDNILDFLLSDFNNDFSYLLRLYLISSIENHKHIERFDNVCKFLYGFESSYVEEIIRNDKDKPVLQKANEIIKEDSVDLELNIIELSDLAVFCNSYIFKEKGKAKNVSVPFKAIDNIKKSYYQKLLNIKIGNKLSSISFDEMKKTYSRIRSEEKDEESAKENLLTVLFDKTKEKNLIKDFVLDLKFNYQVLIFLFNTDCLNKDSIFDILYSIRRTMADNDISLMLQSFPVQNLKPLGVHYRGGNLIKSNSFFANTSDYNDIDADMFELEYEYRAICQIEDDVEYLRNAYNLSKRFLQIHPFEDGNGRTFKYLFYYLCLKRNILPPTITDTMECTSSYFDTFNDNNSDYILERGKTLEKRIERI